MTQFPDGAPEHLVEFLRKHGLDIDFVAPGVPMPTVPLAAQAIDVPEDHIFKTLLFGGDSGQFVVAITNGTNRIDRERLAHAAMIQNPRAANPADVLAVTGYPTGGVAPLGLPASVPVVVDAATAALTVAYGGGGQEHLLLRVQVSDIIRCNNALVADITERPKNAVR
jgi:Cys-tRNA(Pro) deacylase